MSWHLLFNLRDVNLVLTRYLIHEICSQEYQIKLELQLQYQSLQYQTWADIIFNSLWSSLLPASAANDDGFVFMAQDLDLHQLQDEQQRRLRIGYLFLIYWPSPQRRNMDEADCTGLDLLKTLLPSVKWRMVFSGALADSCLNKFFVD